MYQKPFVGRASPEPPAELTVCPRSLNCIWEGLLGKAVVVVV